MKWIFIILFVHFFCFCFSQDSIEAKKKWELNGYIKNVESLSFDHQLRNHTSGNLLHNRININWLPSEKINFVVQLRNRLFWGEDVKQTPGFSSMLKNGNEKLNMQVVWINRNGIVMHTNTERLYAAFRGKNWNAKLGRQRINWGMTTTWNPNDIFNTYNFLDFDYEERPGADGGKFQYLINDHSNVEIASAFNGGRKGHVTAAKYLLNKWNYDMQLIAGWYHEQVTLGAGWAGNIKDAGFKGEVQYFFPEKDSTDRLYLTLECDYVFKKGWYANIGLLFNNQGINRSINSWNSVSLIITPENLMPAKWNMITTVSKEISPLLSANMGVLYAPGTNLLILLPSFRYNLATNLDVDIIGQSFFAEMNNRFEDVNHRFFLRMKWNF